MFNNDFYGNKIKWFVGVVKDVQDPLNSNMVRVWVPGVHPDLKDGSATSSSVGSNPNTTTGTNTGTPKPSSNTSSSSSSSKPVSPGLVKPDANLPNSSQLSMKISRHYTLADLTTSAGPTSAAACQRGIQQGLLTETIIKRLATLAVNCLDPLRDHFGPKMRVTSGWRPAGTRINGKITAPTRHPEGYAADVAVSGIAQSEVTAWIRANLRGRYAALGYNSAHNHIQAEAAESTTANPREFRE